MNNFLMMGVGAMLFVIGLLVAYKLIRVVADLVILAAVVAGFWLIYMALEKGDVSTWGQLILRAPLLGAVVALLTAPVLPFTSWFAGTMGGERKKETKKG